MRNKDTLKQELNERQKQNIKEAFDLFDVDGSGFQSKQNILIYDFRNNRH